MVTCDTRRTKPVRVRITGLRSGCRNTALHADWSPLFVGHTVPADWITTDRASSNGVAIRVAIAEFKRHQKASNGSKQEEVAICLLPLKTVHEVVRKAYVHGRGRVSLVMNMNRLVCS